MDRKTVGAEQRAHPRAEHFMRVPYAVVNTAALRSVGVELPPLNRIGSMLDMGGGGIRLQTPEDIPAEATLMLAISPLPGLPGGTGMFFARIAWKKAIPGGGGFLFGLAFVQLDPEVQERIVRHVLQLRESTRDT